MNIFGLHDCGPKIDDVHVHINMGEIQKGDVIENVMKTSPESDFQAAFTGCIRMNQDTYASYSYKTIQDVRSKEACACKCKEENSCKYFTWNEYSRACNLKMYASPLIKKGRYKNMKGSHSGYQGCCIKKRCEDEYLKCKQWSSIIGRCTTKWMLSRCKKSCKACADDPRWNMECYYSGVIEILEDNSFTLEADEFYKELKDEIVPALLYSIKWRDLPMKIRRKTERPKTHRFQDVKSLAKFSDEDHDDYYNDELLHDRLSDAIYKDTWEIQKTLQSGNEGKKKKNFVIKICPPIMKFH